IDQANTAIAFGSGDIKYNAFSGGRVSTGFWVSCDKVLGFDATFFALETRPAATVFQSDLVGQPVIAQPFFNEVTGVEDARTITAPGLSVGAVAISSTSQLLGADGNARSRVWQNCSGALDVLAGFRYARLNEDLVINSQLTSTSAASVFWFDGTQF